MGNQCGCADEGTGVSPNADDISLRMHPILERSPSPADWLKQADWHLYYGGKAELGKGAYRTVYRAKAKTAQVGENGNRIEPQTLVAVKTMNWNAMVAKEIPNDLVLSAETLAIALDQECSLMQHANHPNIIKLYEVFYAPAPTPTTHLEFAMVMELVPSKVR